jgi:protein glucosyltransferase
MWPVFLFVIVVVVLLPQNLISCNDNNDAETCSIDNKDEGCDGGSKKYTSSWRQYLNDIKFAQSAFKHCEFDDGSPDEFEGLFCNYAKVIEEDLAPYDTISPSMLDDARKVASNPVTYQLIQGVLYRSPTCLFPSRCDGIEHFLLDLASQLPDFELVLNNHDWPFVNK